VYDRLNIEGRKGGTEVIPLEMVKNKDYLLDTYVGEKELGIYD
jgi:ribonuclease P protein subunit POP4